MEQDRKRVRYIEFPEPIPAPEIQPLRRPVTLPEWLDPNRPSKPEPVPVRRKEGAVTR